MQFYLRSSCFPIFILLLNFGLWNWNCAIGQKKWIPVEKHKWDSISHGNQTREFLYYIPDSIIESNNSRFPIVFIFHGGGGSPEGMVYLSRMSVLADQESFVVVYPKGLKGRWNDGRKIPTSWVDQNNINDLGFFESLLTTWKTKPFVDPSRVLLVGLSNGGFMVHKIACESNESIHSISSIGAGISVELAKSCQPKLLPSVFLIHGKKDSVVPYLGGTIQVPGEKPNSKIPLGENVGQEKTRDFWRNRMECKSQEIQNPPNRKGRQTEENRLEIHSNCLENKKLWVWSLENGEHIWPGGFFYKSETENGYLSNDMDATKEIWNFFTSDTKQ